MSEVSVKAAYPKKGFTAPILKDAVTSDEGVSLEKVKNNKKEGEKKYKPSGDGGGKKMSKESKKKDLKENIVPNTDETTLKKPKNPTKEKSSSDPLEKREKPQTQKETKKKPASEPTEKGGKVQTQKEAKKPIVSLTDSQYEEIFSAVLNGFTSKPNSQHNTPIQERSDMSEKTGSETPARKTQGTLKRRAEPVEPQTPVNKAAKLDAKTTPNPSRWGAANKHSDIASSLLKELRESQNSLMKTVNELSSDSDSEVVVQQLSQVSVLGSQTAQPPHTVLMGDDQRTRLEQLQLLRNIGVWVHCCRMSCNKLRYLANITDPQDVPEIWYCHMNPDPRYNDCLREQQEMAPEDQADLIANEHTAGSLVWAQVAGFPWWPAMVDDDPDLEQYYWLADDFETVTFYHVVFFDEIAVTRAWVDVKHITAYKKLYGKKFAQQARGIDFRRRISVAKEQANNALSLTTPERLRVYSFIARYKGHISTSSENVKETMTKYKLKKPDTTERIKKKKISKKDKIIAEIFSGKSLKENKKKQMKKIDKSEKVKKVKRERKVIQVDSASPKNTLRYIENKESDKGNDPQHSKVEGDKMEDSDETNITLSENSVNVNKEKEGESEGTAEKIKSPEKPRENIQSVTHERMTESTSDLVEPSQQIVVSVGLEESGRLSQSTITDFLAKGSEDAVVPEMFLSQDFSQGSEE